MDRHPVISVQQQTSGNDFCHFSISNVSFAFCAFFRKPGKLGYHTESKWWPGDRVTRTWKVTQMTHWPGDPMTQFHVWQQLSVAQSIVGAKRTVCSFCSWLLRHLGLPAVLYLTGPSGFLVQGPVDNSTFHSKPDMWQSGILSGIYFDVT